MMSFLNVTLVFKHISCDIILHAFEANWADQNKTIRHSMGIISINHFANTRPLLPNKSKLSQYVEEKRSPLLDAYQIDWERLNEGYIHLGCVAQSFCC